MVKIKVHRRLFNESYLPALYNRHRYTVLYGGAGSGKSHFITQRFILDLLQDNITLLVIRKTFASHQATTYQAFRDVIEAMGLSGQVRFYKAPLSIQFKNGSSILFKGADNEEKLKSLAGIDYCWVEEANEIEYDIWTQLQLRLRGQGRKKQFFITFNPVDENHWLKQEFFDNKKDDSLVLKTTYRDNKFLDEHYINTLLDLRERNPRYFDIYANGEWGRVGKLVFTNWKKEHFDPYPLMQQHRTVLGLDWGYSNDVTAIVPIILDDKEKRIYLYDEIYETGLLNDAIAQKVIERQWHKMEAYGDSSEPKTIADLKRHGLRRLSAANKGKNSVEYGIHLLQQYELVVHPRCQNILHELNNYSYKKDKTTGNYLNEPEDRFNHAIDGCRYALVGALGIQQFSTLPKHAFGL